MADKHADKVNSLLTVGPTICYYHFLILVSLFRKKKFFPLIIAAVLSGLEHVKTFLKLRDLIG